MPPLAPEIRVKVQAIDQALRLMPPEQRAAIMATLESGRDGHTVPSPIIKVSETGLNIWTHEQLVAHNFGTPEYFVDQIIAPGGVTVGFGAREAGKTQLDLTLMRAIQEESLFLGRFQARHARCAYFQFDMPPSGFQARLRGAINSCVFNPEYARFITGNGSTINTLDYPKKNCMAPQLRRVFDEIREWEPEVVFFDSLRKSYVGNENDTGMPSQVYGAWHEMFPKSALVTNHHVSKPPSQWEQRKKGNTKFYSADEIESYRGTTAWLDDANYAVLVAYNKQADRRTVQLVRGQTLDEAVKKQLIAVQMEQDGLFLVPTELTPTQRLIEYRLQHPTHTKQQAVEWISIEFPKRSEVTYYRWARDAGYAAG